MTTAATELAGSAQATEVLDVKGLNCPLPILKTKQRLAQMNSGEILHILATDPASTIDFKAFCLRTPNELLEYSEQPDLFQFLIRKA